MNTQKLKEIISGGEGLNVEFKESHKKLNKDVFRMPKILLQNFYGLLCFIIQKNEGSHIRFQIYCGLKTDVFNQMN